MSAGGIVRRGLALPLELYLQPERFKREIDALAGDERKLTIWRALCVARTDAAARSTLLQLLAAATVALTWPALIGALLDLVGVPISWIAIAFGVAHGVFYGVVVGVVFEVAVGVAFGVAVGVAFGVALGVAAGAGGVAAVVALGVAFGVPVGVVFGVACGVALDPAGGVALGVAGGALLGIDGGVALGVAGGVVDAG